MTHPHEFEDKPCTLLIDTYATFLWLLTFPMLLLHLTRERSPFFFFTQGLLVFSVSH
jgi:hypothetical protein